jgi:hypothetical protein
MELKGSSFLVVIALVPSDRVCRPTGHTPPSPRPGDQAALPSVSRGGVAVRACWNQGDA